MYVCVCPYVKVVFVFSLSVSLCRCCCLLLFFFVCIPCSCRTMTTETPNMATEMATERNGRHSCGPSTSKSGAESGDRNAFGTLCVWRQLRATFCNDLLHVHWNKRMNDLLHDALQRCRPSLTATTLLDCGPCAITSSFCFSSNETAVASITAARTVTMLFMP